MVGVSRILAGSILVASVAVVVAWFAARHEIAGWLVERRLGSALRDFVVEEVTLDRLVVTDIVLAQAAWVRRAEATWLTPRRDGTLTLSGLEMPWPDGSLALPDALPGNIVLEDARVAVSLPWGAVDLGLDARLANRPDGIAGSGRWRARFDGGSADGAVSLRLDRATGALQLEFTPRRIDHRHLVLGPPAGRIVVERRAGLDPDVRAWLEWPSVEAAGLALGTVTVEAAADASGLGGTLTIAREDSPVHGAVTFARTGAALELAGELAADLGTGNATVALAFEASLPEGGDPAGWTVEAEGAVETAGFRLAPWLAGGALRAPLALAMREGVARVWLDGPVALDVRSALLPAPASLRLPHRGAWLDARRGDDGWDLEAGIEGAGGTADGQALEFAAAGAGRLGPDGLALSLPRIDLALAGPRAAGSLEGSLSLDGSRGSWRANLGLVGLLETVQTDGAAAVNVAFDVPATMTFGEDGLSVATESSALVHVAELRAGPAVLGGLVVELPLHLSDLERGIEVRLTDTGWIDLMTFEHELLRTLGPASIALQREALPMFVLELLGDDLSWDLRLKADGTPVNAALWPGGSRPVIAEGLLPDIGFRLESLGTRYLQATMEANGGDLRLRGPDLGFAGIRALVNYNSALSPWPQVSADIRRLEDLREPRRFGPLSFDVVSSPVWPEGDDARISVTAHSEAARFLGAVDAVWSPGKDRLEATVRTNGLDFDHRGTAARGPGAAPRVPVPGFQGLPRSGGQGLGRQGRERRRPRADRRRRLGPVRGSLLRAACRDRHLLGRLPAGDAGGAELLDRASRDAVSASRRRGRRRPSRGRPHPRRPCHGEASLGHAVLRGRRRRRPPPSFRPRRGLAARSLRPGGHRSRRRPRRRGPRRTRGRRPCRQRRTPSFRGAGDRHPGGRQHRRLRRTGDPCGPGGGSDLVLAGDDRR